MKTCTDKQIKTIILIITISFALFSLEGCSSVHVVAEQASLADDICTETTFSLWWGISDPELPAQCRGEGLKYVSVKTNWFYSVCSFITLGAVVPMDIEYRCTSVHMLDGGVIGSLEEMKP